MIYLIKTNYGVMSLLKIGYTNDLESRLKTYKTHNPRVELISTREGGPGLENYLHKYFSEYSYQDQPEWFYFNDYIIDNFSKVNPEDCVLKENLMNILSRLFGKQDIKDLENKYIEKYGNEDFQLRKYYLHRFWNDLNESLSEYTLGGDCPDKVPIDSIITVKDLPFELGSISFNLHQIMGRQKLDSNSSENIIEFYYKNDDRKKLSQALINKKIENTEAAISLVENAINERDQEQAIRFNKLSIVVEKYKTNYVSLSYKNGKEEFVLNNLVMVAEQRAFDIQNIYYSDRFVMFNTIDAAIGSNTRVIGEEVSRFLEKYRKLTKMSDKLRIICEYGLSEEAQRQVESLVELEVRNYLNLGKEKLKALGYNNLKKFITSKTNELSIDLSSIIYREFTEGSKLTKKELKEKLGKIYLNNGIASTAKASDIEKWFEVRRCRITINKKQLEGLELIKKLK